MVFFFEIYVLSNFSLLRRSLPLVMLVFSIIPDFHLHYFHGCFYCLTCAVNCLQTIIGEFGDGISYSSESTRRFYFTCRNIPSMFSGLHPFLLSSWNFVLINVCYCLIYIVNFFMLPIMKNHFYK